MIVMSTPVAAACHAPSAYHCANGYNTTAIRTAWLNSRVAAQNITNMSRQNAAGNGDNTIAAPTHVRTLRPPRNLANTGQAWPIIAAPAPRNHTRQSVESSWATSTAATPFDTSPTKIIIEWFRPSTVREFQNPGFRSPTSRRFGAPARLVTMSATGIEPST